MNPACSNIISYSGEMKRFLIFVAVALLVLRPPDSRAQTSPDRERILETAGRIEDTYGGLRSYACDIEGIYFSSGKEFQRYVFKFNFRKPDRFRIEFSRPYSGVTIFYTEGEKEFTARPLAAYPSAQFRVSVDNPLFKSPTGQKLSQLHMNYFLAFLKRNASELPQDDSEFRYDEEAVSFWLSARDYLTGKAPERYRIFINKKVWLPARFERYDMMGIPLEFTIFRNYRIDPAFLDKSFFDPAYRIPAAVPPMEPVRP
jgi:outer membrane lipoprotein-sorting protein